MGLRCSLLGCEFGESTIEHEREERGSEVVLTVTEYEECKRCGARNIISENTGVTSIAAEPDSHESAVDEEASTPESEAESTTDEADTDEDSLAPNHPAEVVPETEPLDADPNESDTAVTEAESVEIPTDEDGEPITDDGEILAPEPEESTERAYGEWPENSDVGPPNGVETSEDDAANGEPARAETGDEDERTPSDDAVIIDYVEPTAEEASATATSEAETETQPSDEESGIGIKSASKAPVPGEAATTTTNTAEFFCPNCSFTTPVTQSSLRPGDICPECKRGYLGERDA